MNKQKRDENKEKIIEDDYSVKISKKEMKEIDKTFGTNHADKPADTEDGKHILLNLKGILKLTSPHKCDNKLWNEFINNIDLKKYRFKNTTPFQELIKHTQKNKSFRDFNRILILALKKPLLIFKHHYNFLDFMKLCNLYGEIYGFEENEMCQNMPIEFYAEFLHKASYKMFYELVSQNKNKQVNDNYFI